MGLSLYSTITSTRSPALTPGASSFPSSWTTVSYLRARASMTVSLRDESTGHMNPANIISSLRRAAGELDLGDRPAEDVLQAESPTECPDEAFDDLEAEMARLRQVEVLGKLVAAIRYPDRDLALLLFHVDVDLAGNRLVEAMLHRIEDQLVEDESD